MNCTKAVEKSFPKNIQTLATSLHLTNTTSAAMFPVSTFCLKFFLQIFQQDDRKLETAPFFNFHLPVKVARQAILVFLSEAALKLSAAHSAGDHPTCPSGICSAMFAIKAFLLCCRTCPKVSCLCTALLSSAFHVLPAIYFHRKYTSLKKFMPYV